MKKPILVHLILFSLFLKQSCTLICRFGLINSTSVSYDFVHCSTWRLSNSQCKVATLIIGQVDFCCVSSFAVPSWYSLQKNYNYVFDFVEVMFKVPWVHLSRNQCIISSCSPTDGRLIGPRDVHSCKAVRSLPFLAKTLKCKTWRRLNCKYVDI